MNREYHDSPPDRNGAAEVTAQIDRMTLAELTQLVLGAADLDPNDSPATFEAVRFSRLALLRIWACCRQGLS